MKERLVIVGGGMAAARLVDELTARAPGRLRHHRDRRGAVASL